MRLLLIRRGQTTANVAHELDITIPGAPLTARGRQQAASMPGRLAAERFGGIWCSRAQRAQDMAAALAAGTGHQPQVMPGLHEIPAGDREMSASRGLVYLPRPLGEMDPRRPGLPTSTGTSRSTIR